MAATLLLAVSTAAAGCAAALPEVALADGTVSVPVDGRVVVVAEERPTDAEGPVWEIAVDPDPGIVVVVADTTEPVEGDARRAVRRIALEGVGPGTTTLRLRNVRAAPGAPTEVEDVTVVVGDGQPVRTLPPGTLVGLDDLDPTAADG